MPERPPKSGRRTRPQEPDRDAVVLPTGGRLWLLRVLLVVFAFLLLAGIEWSLRLAGVADPEPLVHRVQEGPFDVYSINARVGLRFFPPEMEAIMPKPGFRIFPAQKSPETVRIFVLGGSTAAGFPYHTHGSISGLLEDRLARLLPEHRVEVVNFAMTALNSYAVLDYVRELGRYEPDLYLIYSGHNEYYGAFGPASAVAFGRDARVIRFLRWVLSLRITRLLDRALDAIRGEPEPVRGQTLMGAMVGRTDIRYGGDIYRAGMEGYERNLRELVRAAGETPVLFCEVVSNLRDIAPFGSTPAPALDETDVQTLAGTIARGWEFRRGGAMEEAAETAARAVAIDSTYAEARYLGARVAEARGEHETARREYRAARDYDGIRFRAPSRANEILRELVAESSAYLVPVEERFARFSAPYAPGADQFLEHVHPNLPATQRIVDAIIELLRADPDLVRARGWDDARDLDAESYLRLSGVSELDHEIADRRIFHLTRRWPYPERESRYRSARPEFIQRLAQAFLDDDIDLAEAHAQAGEAYLERGELAEAAFEYATSCKIFPVLPQRFARAGQIHLRAGDLDGARALLEHGRALRPSSVFEQYLAEVELEMGEPEAALERIQNVSWSGEQFVPARMLEANALWRLGRAEEARRAVEAARRVDPEHPYVQRYDLGSETEPPAPR